MRPADFMRAVWPSVGVYCIAHPATKGYIHKTFDTIDDALKYLRTVGEKNTFFAVHSLSKHRVPNPEAKSGFSVRTQDNAAYVRCFYIDLDIADEADDDHYGSQMEAVVALQRMCTDYSLPQPTLLSSGKGVHAYFLLEDEMASLDWFPYAQKFKAILRHAGLKFDPVVPADRARILRVPKTWNTKPGRAKLPVEIKVERPATANRKFLHLIDMIVEENEINVDTRVFSKNKDAGDILSRESNVVREFQADPVTMLELIQACPQMRRQAELRGKVSQSEWFYTLQLVQHVVNGRSNCHKISKGDPRYNFDDCEAMLDRLSDKGPTKCSTLRDVCGAKHCEGCQFQKVVCPLDAARQNVKAPEPKLVAPVGLDVDQEEITIKCPSSFSRKPDGRIVRIMETEGGKQFEVPVLHHDLYPIRVLRRTDDGPARHVWRFRLPRDKVAQQMELNGELMNDTKALARELGRNGIVVDLKTFSHLVDYMSAYIKSLMALVDSEEQRTHLGWSNGYKDFILPQYVLDHDGKKKPVSLTRDTQQIATQLQRIDACGDLQAQIDAMDFYDHPAFIKHQVAILASLAAPLFAITGYGGALISMFGPSGASKSTALYAGASFWGHPEHYAINATSGGSTQFARDKVIEVLSNLPIYMDELTGIKDEATKKFVMNVTQKKGRTAGHSSGGMRMPPGNEKSTLVVCTVNHSLHPLLAHQSAEGTAGSMRVFEMEFIKEEIEGIRTMADANRFMRVIRQNYGHIGPYFMRKALPQWDHIVERVINEMDNLNALCKADGAERYLTAVPACIIVACQLANELNLLPFNAMQIKTWFITQQMREMRDVVREEHASADPLVSFADFLAEINGEIMTVEPSSMQGEQFPNVTPRGRFSAHADANEGKMWVVKKRWKDYCKMMSLNERHQSMKLKEAKLFIGEQRKVLGAGTPYHLGKAAVPCYIVDLKHPMMVERLKNPTKGPRLVVDNDAD